MNVKRFVDRTLWWEIVLLLLGTFIIAWGLNAFLIPNKIASGGVSGFSTIIYYLTGFPVGALMLILNIPIFYAAYRIWGWGTIARSLLASVALSVFIDWQAATIFPQAWTQNTFLAVLYGGIITGIGTGLVFRARGTTGGTDLIAKMIQKYSHYSVGNCLLAIDGCVILLAALVFNIELALFALISVYVNSRMLDTVQQGISYSKAAFIVSDQYKQIGEELMRQLERGVTGLDSRGLYTNQKRETLLCVVAQSEVSEVKRIVYTIDKKAFIVITNAHEVLGEGFRPLDQVS